MNFVTFIWKLQSYGFRFDIRLNIKYVNIKDYKTQCIVDETCAFQLFFWLVAPCRKSVYWGSVVKFQMSMSGEQLHERDISPLNFTRFNQEKKKKEAKRAQNLFFFFVTFSCCFPLRISWPPWFILWLTAGAQPYDWAYTVVETRSTLSSCMGTDRYQYLKGLIGHTFFCRMSISAFDAPVCSVGF